MDFVDRRAAELVRLYLHEESRGYDRLVDVAARLVMSPSSRFWVSEERAAAVVGGMLSGRDVLVGMRPPKRAMYEEIFRRFMALRCREPWRGIYELMHDVVMSPAPCFYMSASWAASIIYTRLKQRRRKHHGSGQTQATYTKDKGLERPEIC